MGAMRARGFNGYGDLKLVNLPKPEASNGKVLVRMTAGGKRMYCCSHQSRYCRQRRDASLARLGR